MSGNKYEILKPIIKQLINSVEIEYDRETGEEVYLANTFKYGSYPIFISEEQYYLLDEILKEK